MTSLNERMVGVIFCMLSGYAFADGLFIDSPAEMTVASIEPLPVEHVLPIPNPQRFLQCYEMEFQSNQSKAFYSQIEDFYSAQVMRNFRFGAGNATPAPEPAAPQASFFLHPGPSTALQLSIVQLPNTALTLHTQPQRRLSLTVNDWIFSATARLAVLHSHDTGATLSARHGF